MKLHLTAALLLSLALPVTAAPQWPAFEPYLPDSNGLLVVVNVDRDAKDTLLSALPIDPVLVQKIIDEHFGAFAQASGIRVTDITGIFGGMATAGTTSSPGVVGLQMPLDLPKVAKALKGTPGAVITESPDQVKITKGPGCWVFLKEGTILIGKTDAVDAIVKRKGASPSNTAFMTTARARAATSTNLFLTAALPPGLFPPLPDHPWVAKANLDPQISTHLTGLTVSSNDGGFAIALEFDDAAYATKLAASYAAGMKAYQDKLSADVALAETKAANMGILGAFHMELVQNRMSLESAVFVTKSLTVKPEGKTATIAVPRELLKSFKGGGTIMSMGIAAAAAAPALKAYQGKLLGK